MRRDSGCAHPRSPLQAGECRVLSVTHIRNRSDSSLKRRTIPVWCALNAQPPTLQVILYSSYEHPIHAARTTASVLKSSVNHNPRQSMRMCGFLSESLPVSQADVLSHGEVMYKGLIPELLTLICDDVVLYARVVGLLHGPHAEGILP